MSTATLLDRAVEAPITYLARNPQRPYAYAYDPPAGVPRRFGEPDPHVMRIEDARPRAGSLSLDREGFAFGRHPTAVRDFYDREEVERVYYPEMERLVAQATGAEKVVLFDHTIRTGALSERAANGLREPAKRVHNDYTEASAPKRVRDLLPPDEAEARLKRRFGIVNVWRPIVGPVEESPLALCDAASVAPEDLVISELRYRDRTGETYAVTWDPRHRWSYFPGMQRDEVVFIKCFDSANDGRARFSVHTAFDDPRTPPHAPRRESIEVRTLVFF